MQECGFAGLTAFARSYCGDRDGLGWAGLGVELEVEWGVWSWSCQSSSIAVRSMRAEDACCVVSCRVGWDMWSRALENCHYMTDYHDTTGTAYNAILSSLTLPRDDHCVGSQISHTLPAVRRTVCDACVPSREELLLV